MPIEDVNQAQARPAACPRMVLLGQRTLVLVEGPQVAASGDNMEIKTLCQIIIEEKKENYKHLTGYK